MFFDGELSEEREDSYLLSEMEKVKDEPLASAEEAEEFRKWLRSPK